MWYSENGERLGTYIAPTDVKAAVNSVDVDFFSRRLIAGYADSVVKVWDVETGKELYNIKHESMVQCVKFGESGDRFLTSDAWPNKPSTLRTFSMKQIEQEGEAEALARFDVKSKGKVLMAGFTSLEEKIVTAGEDGYLHVFETETGDLENRLEAHAGPINDLRFSKDGTTFITASGDNTAKVFYFLPLLGRLTLLDAVVRHGSHATLEDLQIRQSYQLCVHIAADGSRAFFFRSWLLASKPTSFDKR